MISLNGLFLIKYAYNKVICAPAETPPIANCILSLLKPSSSNISLIFSKQAVTSSKILNIL